MTKSSRTGIFYSNEKKYDEYSCPTLIIDNKDINLISKSDINMRGTVITTPGHLYVEAENFNFTVSKLKHTYESSSFGISATLCNQQFLSSHNPCDFSGPLFGGDPTVCRLNQLANSNGAVEGVLNTWSTGIDLVNSANAFVNGLRTNTLITEAVKREVPSIYAPQLGINLTKNTQSVYSESLGEGSINVGSADIDVNKTIKIKGAPVQVQEDFNVYCTNFIVEGEQLRSEVDQKTQNLNLTVSVVGDPYQVGVSTSQCHTSAKTQVNEQIEVGGKLTIHAKTFVQDGANIDVGKIEGEVENYKIITRTDEVYTSSSSFGISSGGDFNFSQQSGSSVTVNQASTLHVRDSINGSPDEFTVHHLESVGGKILSDKQNNFHADTIDARDVKEEQTSSGFCINGNVKNYVNPDIQTNHLLPQDNQSRQITTTNIGINNSHYEADNKTVIHGEEGTHVTADVIHGDIETQSSDGRKIKDNTSHNYNIVVPHIDDETKKQFEKNAKWAESKIVEAEHKIQKAVTQFFKPPVEKKINEDSYRKEIEKKYPWDDKKISHPTSDDSNKDNDSLEPWEQRAVDDYNSKLDEDSYTKNSEMYVDRKEDLQDMYLEGKLAGATGYIPDDIGNYSEEEQARFYQGYYDTKNQQIGAEIGLTALVGTILSPFASAAMETITNAVSLGLRTYGLFQKAAQVTEDVFHVVESIENAESVFKGVDSDYFRSSSRFGEAFYISEDPETCMLELLHYDQDPEFAIRFELNREYANILDFTDPEIADYWGYVMGEITPEIQTMGRRAQSLGYNMIKYPSERGLGNNYAVFKDFENLLIPKRITPTSRPKY